MKFQIVEEAINIAAPESSREKTILLETIRYYYGNPRAVNEWSCEYESASGATCAVGRCMLAHKRRSLGKQNNDSVVELRNFNSLLKSRYRGLVLNFWQALQGLHDENHYWNDRGARGMTLAGAYEAILLASDYGKGTRDDWRGAKEYLKTLPRSRKWR